MPVEAGATISLRIEGLPIPLEGVITRCTMRLERGSSVYRSGISFKHSKQYVPAALKDLLSRELHKAIELWKANARGALPADVEQMPLFSGESGMRSHRRRPRSFIWYRLSRDGWQKSVTLDPNQPLDGFAVSADDDQRQMSLLQETYEKSDESGRQLIRLLAHLAIASALE